MPLHEGQGADLVVGAIGKKMVVAHVRHGAARVWSVSVLLAREIRHYLRRELRHFIRKLCPNFVVVRGRGRLRLRLVRWVCRVEVWLGGHDCADRRDGRKSYRTRGESLCREMRTQLREERTL